MTITYELETKYDRAKSFYGKARVRINENGDKILTSYKTDVAAILANGDFVRLWDDYSATTARHVDEFRQQNGLPKICKKDWNALQVAF